MYFDEHTGCNCWSRQRPCKRIKYCFLMAAQSEPVIAFITDPSSGIYHTDASNVAIVVGGEAEITYN